MNKSDFYYDLPKELIAQTPLAERSASRLLTLDKISGDVKHRRFTDILELLNPNDCLVVNNTKVIPARLIGQKATGGAVELLLLANKGDNVWECLVKPGRGMNARARLSFGEGQLQAEVVAAQEDGNRLVKFSYEGIFEEILDELGLMPLPPYITEKLEDKDRLQTVYAQEAGAAAASTAGLHFTEELLEKIKEKGVTIANITLHIGLGTFRPVKTDNILEHEMHSEFYVLDPTQVELMQAAKNAGGRIVCVGTSAVRTLETCTDKDGVLRANTGYTGMFIYPGHKFQTVDGLITNFHLPESTLIMLVSALATREHILNAYKQAIKERYRFFSFGDAMFIH